MMYIIIEEFGMEHSLVASHSVGIFFLLRRMKENGTLSHIS